MKTALVTGGAGLIGSHIVDLLLEHGYQVKILDKLEQFTHPAGKPAWILREAEFIEGDVRNPEDWIKALQGVHIVFHQAAWGGFSPDISKMTETNVSGTVKLFEAIRTHRLPIEKIVVASSQAVYGEGKYLCEEHGVFHPPLRTLEQLERGEWEVWCPSCRTVMQPLPIDEGVCPDVTGVYSATKYAQERLVLALGKEFGIPTVALRYALTYGPRQSLFNPYTGICSIFSMRILASEPPVVFEDGLQTRDFTFVRDVAAANLHVMECNKANYEVFNVGTGIATTIWEFACTLALLYGRPEIKPVLPNEFRPLDLRHLVTDNRKLMKLGWKPQYSLDQGLAEYVAWIKGQDRPAVYFEQALTQLRKLRVVRSVQQPR